MEASLWINTIAKVFIESVLGSVVHVFEWGAGGSTLYYAQRAMDVISVEHDPSWAHETILARGDLHNCIVLLRQPEGGELGDDPANPDHYLSSNHPGLNFKEYASAIDSYPDDFFDYVAVDGRARPSCIKHAIPKVKPGGWLMLDDSERPNYLKHTRHLLANWAFHIMWGPKGEAYSETMLFRRPYGD